MRIQRAPNSLFTDVIRYSVGKSLEKPPNFRAQQSCKLLRSTFISDAKNALKLWQVPLLNVTNAIPKWESGISDCWGLAHSNYKCRILKRLLVQLLAPLTKNGLTQ